MNTTRKTTLMITKIENANLADQGEEEQYEVVNEVDEPPENENEVPTLIHLPELVLLLTRCW